MLKIVSVFLANHQTTRSAVKRGLHHAARLGSLGHGRGRENTESIGKASVKRSARRGPDQAAGPSGYWVPICLSHMPAFYVTVAEMTVFL